MIRFLFTVDRPGHRAVLARHLAPAVLTFGALLAAFFLPLDRIPYTLCLFLRLTGYPCPSCGFTRAFVAMADGQWPAVMHLCPLAALLYASAVLVFAVNAAALLCGVRLTPGRLFQWRLRTWMTFFCFFGLLILSNWLYRLVLGLK